MNKEMQDCLTTFSDLLNEGHPMSEIMRKMGISKATYFRYLKIFRQGKKIRAVGKIHDVSSCVFAVVLLAIFLLQEMTPLREALIFPFTPGLDSGIIYLY